MKKTEQQKALKKFFKKNPYPSKEDKEELSSELNMPTYKINNWFTGQRRRYKQENMPLPGEESVSSRRPGRRRTIDLTNENSSMTEDTSVAKSPFWASSEPITTRAVAIISQPIERLPPWSTSTPARPKEKEDKTNKRSRYSTLLKELNQSRNEHADEIMELQEKIMALQQKLEDKTQLYKSETEMIDKLKANATVEDIQLSEEEDDQADDEDIAVNLLNIKGEPAAEEN